MPSTWEVCWVHVCIGLSTDLVSPSSAGSYYSSLQIWGGEDQWASPITITSITLHSGHLNSWIKKFFKPLPSLSLIYISALIVSPVHFFNPCHLSSPKPLSWRARSTSGICHCWPPLLFWHLWSLLGHTIFTYSLLFPLMTLFHCSFCGSHPAPCSLYPTACHFYRLMGVSRAYLAPSL